MESSTQITASIESKKTSATTPMVSTLAQGSARLHVSPKQVLVALLAILTLLASAECVARVLAVSQKTRLSHYRMYDLKHQLAIQPVESGKKLVFFMGDSLMTFAAFPEHIESVLQERGIDADIRNIAALSNTPQMSIYLLQSALQAKNKPDYVVFNVSPRILDQSFKGHNPIFETSYMNKCQLKAETANSLLCALEKHLYLLRFRDHLKQTIQGFPKAILQADQQLLSRSQMEYHPVEEFSHKGWVPNFQVSKPAELTKSYERRYDRYLSGEESVPADITPFIWSTEHIQSFITYCQENNVPLILVFLPEPQFQAKSYLVRKTSRTAFIAQVQQAARQWNVPFVDGQPLNIADTAFSDESHLNTLGSVALSKFFADTLAPRLNRNTGASP